MTTPSVSIRSEAQRQASRDNAQLSTGPLTPEGKAASSLNAYKHGYTSINPSSLSRHHQEALDDVRKSYARELAATGATQTDLARRIADESFRIRLIEKDMEELRAAAIEQERRELGARIGNETPERCWVEALADPSIQHRLSLLLRYKSASERAYYRAYSMFLQIRKLHEIEERDAARRESERIREQQRRAPPPLPEPPAPPAAPAPGSPGFVSQKRPASPATKKRKPAKPRRRAAK